VNNKTTNNGVKPRNKILWLIMSIFIITGLASFGWFWGAGKLETFITGKIENISARGQTVTCNNLEVKGYPFRIGVHCSNTSIDGNQQRLGITAGALRTTAQIYSPGHIISELEGPMRISNRSNQLEANWTNLRASSSIDLSSLTKGSIEATDLNVTLDLPNNPEIGTLTAQNAQVHLRQNANDLDFAASGATLLFTNTKGDVTVPMAGINLITTILDQASVLDHVGTREQFNIKGSQIVLQELKIEPSLGSHLTLSGPLSVSTQGLISGQLAAKIKNIKGFEGFIQNLRPELAANISTAISILGSLNSSNADSDITINLTIKNGRVQAGFIPLGMIPAI
jgi:hypothetical protein